MLCNCCLNTCNGGTLATKKRRLITNFKAVEGSACRFTSYYYGQRSLKRANNIVCMWILSFILRRSLFYTYTNVNFFDAVQSPDYILVLVSLGSKNINNKLTSLVTQFYTHGEVYQIFWHQFSRVKRSC